MTGIMTFSAAGSPRAVSRAIEACAGPEDGVSALVVPWESDATTLRMSVTAVKKDGFAIEHTNLGTIRLVAAGDGKTEVAIDSDLDGAAQESLAGVLDRFVRQVQTRLQGASR